MTLEVTREELYRDVWARPVTQVAADYGISNVALKKICRKHGIPVPGRGHWQRKAARKKIGPAQRLGAGKVGEPIVIRGSRLPDLPPAVREAQRRAREMERRAENRVEVVAAPADLHPSVSATWAALDQVAPNEIGLVAVSGPGVFHVDVAQEQVPRAMVFLNALVTAAEQRGCRLDQGEDALAFVIDSQAVDFTLLELVERTPHVTTEEEKLAVEKWENLLRMLAEVKSVATEVSRPEIPEFDFSRSGRLQVTLAESQAEGRGLRRKFCDGANKNLESLTNAILEGLAVWAAAMKVGGASG